MSVITSKLDLTQPITQPMSIKTCTENGRFTVTISNKKKKVPDNITKTTYVLFTDEGTRTIVGTNSETDNTSNRVTPQYKLSSNPTKKRRLNDLASI